MKKDLKNNVHLEGRLYQHNLSLKTTGPNSKAPGTQFISGTLDVATDDNITNIVTVHYTYVTAKYGSSGKDNPNFKVLNDIIDGKYLTCMADGSDVATKVSIDTNIGLNDFYSDRDKDENGEPKLVSAKRNEGGFIRIVKDLKAADKDRNNFTADIVITGMTRREADPERDLPEKGIIKGAIFDFRNALLPVEFSVTAPQAIDYFEGLEPSAKNPVFTRVKGTEISEVVKRTITQEGAFGDEVREVNSTRRDWVITWAQAEPFEWDSEETITAAELTKAMQDRQIYLAEVKKRYDEYKESQGNAIAAAPAKNTAATTFEF